MKFAAARLARPLIRSIPRGKRTVSRLFGLAKFNDPDWQHAPYRHRVFFDRAIQAYVAVDLAGWTGRWYYFHGVYYDRANQFLIKRLLKPGDTYLDIGAAVGYHTMCASRQVGETGRVICVEPMPHSMTRLKAHLTINAIDNCDLHNVGLSDEPGELTLASDGRGVDTFTTADQAQNVQVLPVVRADELLENTPIGGRLLIKIDTEGFERKVLGGMPKLLARENVILSVEITNTWLKNYGSSAQDLFDFLKSFGYAPYRMDLKWRGLILPGLGLEPMQSPADDRWQYDVVFARQSSDVA